jgi:hypothetical protein
VFCLPAAQAGGLGSHARTRASARQFGIELKAAKLREAKRSFVLMPRWWVAERNSASMARFRRLVRGHARLGRTLAGFRFAAFACRILARAVQIQTRVHNRLWQGFVGGLQKALNRREDRV